MANEISLPQIYGGQSPLTQAAIAQYQQATLPMIQNQMALQGLSNSPALGMAMGSSLAQALPQFIMGGEQLNQSGARTMADIASMQQQGQLSANQQALNAMMGLSQNSNQAAAAQGAQQQAAMQGFGSAGSLQQNISQQQLDNAHLDFLRRQGLAEQATTGLFGGTTLPPTLQQGGSSQTSSSK